MTTQRSEGCSHDASAHTRKQKVARALPGSFSAWFPHRKVSSYVIGYKPSTRVPLQQWHNEVVHFECTLSRLCMHCNFFEISHTCRPQMTVICTCQSSVLSSACRGAAAKREQHHLSTAASRKCCAPAASSSQVIFLGS